MWLTTRCGFPSSLPNHNYHIFLDKNPQIKLCSTNAETQGVYWVPYINFSLQI